MVAKARLPSAGTWRAWRCSFVMVGRVARMLELVREVRPGDVADLEGTSAEPDALAAAYDRLAAWNFSRDFLARVPQHLMVARAGDLGWSDWGTPQAIERTLAALPVGPPWRAPLSATAEGRRAGTPAGPSHRTRMNL